jgi:uncharacterized protein
MLIETLTAGEARVLGTLLEKHLATPDYYPMTLNALRNACNQKSNREPVTEYGDEAVAEALAGLKRKTLVAYIPYGSQGTQYKYRHFLEDPRFNLHKPDLAVLAVLLLRGSQTLNEVRLRASSLHPLASLEEAEAVLTGLASREEPLAERLSRRPGWKEPRWRDRLRGHPEDEDNREATQGSAADGVPAPASNPGGIAPRVPPAAGADADADGEVEVLKREVASLREEVAATQMEVAATRTEVAALREIVERIRSELF